MVFLHSSSFVQVSFLGAINMLGLAKRVKAKILQASTSEVYGDPEISPQREDYLGYGIAYRSNRDDGFKDDANISICISIYLSMSIDTHIHSNVVTSTARVSDHATMKENESQKHFSLITIECMTSIFASRAYSTLTVQACIPMMDVS
jgi:hypothetical protein